jgi:nucleotide-binding universal stress UspA family protein
MSNHSSTKQPGGIMSEPNDQSTTSLRPPPLEHIFVATDFSRGAAQAVDRAALLPLARGGRVSLVHVLPPGLPDKARASAEEAANLQLEQAAAAFSRSTSSAGRDDIRISPELCQGQAYVEIIRRARSAGADLLVLGRHGRRPVKDMFIGSTAERVIRTGDLAVLVVSHKAARSYRRPLLAVDLEDTSRSVVGVMLRVLGPEVNVVTMVHAYHVPFEGFLSPGVSSTEMTRFRKEYRHAAASGLAKLQASLADLGMTWRTSILRGDPRTAIVAEAVRHRADLLTVGTHGRSGLSHALLGSVAEWVIQAAACDVLVARPARVSFELP